jgi:N utilization substance protein B
MKNSLEINNILREFYKISGFRISIHDTEYNEIYAYPQKLSPYCSIIQSNPYNKKECIKNDRTAFKKIICGNDAINEYLQDKSIYWNDDIAIVETFTLKTIKQFEESAGSQQKLLPMFKDLEDQSFAIKLFRQTLINGPEYRERINKHMKNWETERIANMDLIIMQIALSEIMNFPSIPINVTLNEYIDTAKFYSTPKSGTFINGILDSIVNELKKEKLLLKD